MSDVTTLSELVSYQSKSVVSHALLKKPQGGVTPSPSIKAKH